MFLGRKEHNIIGNTWNSSYRKKAEKFYTRIIFPAITVIPRRDRGSLWRDPPEADVKDKGRPLLTCLNI